MVENPISFRDYVNKAREVLKDEFGEEFIEQLTDERTIDELKTVEFLINDNIEYHNAIYVAVEEDPDGKIVLSVGNALSEAGIYEFSDIQAEIHNTLQKAIGKIRDLQHQNKLFAVLYPAPQTKVRAYPTISVLDYGIYYLDDVGNRWSMFLPLEEVHYYFDNRPPLYTFGELLRWALKSETLGIVFGWLADYLIDEIDELNRLVEGSWFKYNDLTED